MWINKNYIEDITDCAKQVFGNINVYYKDVDSRIYIQFPKSELVVEYQPDGINYYFKEIDNNILYNSHDIGNYILNNQLIGSHYKHTDTYGSRKNDMKSFIHDFNFLKKNYSFVINGDFSWKKVVIIENKRNDFLFKHLDTVPSAKLIRKKFFKGDKSWKIDVEIELTKIGFIYNPETGEFTKS